MNYSNYLNRDYKSLGSATGRGPRLQRKHLHWLAALSAVAGLAALLSPSHEAEATRQITQAAVKPAVTEQRTAQPGEALEVSAQPVSLNSEHRLNLDLALPERISDQPAEAAIEAEKALPWESVSVRSGDSLSLIFDRLKLSPQQLHAVVQADQDNQLATALRPGQQLKFQIEQGRLKAIKYIISPEKSLYITRKGEQFQSHVIEHPVEIRLTHAAGEIESSLFLSGMQAGLSDNIIMELVNIFGWDVDFALDIRKGDQFTLLFEEHYLDGEKLRDGKILAAEFTNRGNTYRAVRFTDDNGQSQYYSPEGKSMRKAFLRSPVDFRRISSQFQPERYHPVLGKKRPHRGVDYAAATGTPIKAAGDGKVIFRGRKGGYGNTVVLQHGGNITTLYAHMSKFKRGVGSGSRVKQGQIIGYVGATGLATGPHLHYEFRINGAHRNPLTVELPDAEPIQARYKDDFMQQSRQLLAQLDALKGTQVAEIDTP
ncbi:MAG: OapA family protein [Pseudomonadota bacterium]